MKRILSFAASLMALVLASSCVQEQFGPEPSDEVTATFTIAIPHDAATKAYGDGKFADKNVIIGLYDENGNLRGEPKVLNWKAGDLLSQSVEITFLMGKTYQIVFWAQYGDAYGKPADIMSAKKITMPYSSSNMENLDAFYAYVEPFTVTKDFSKSIVMKRPFAQVNFATTPGDIEEAIAAGIEPKAEVTITNAANTLYLLGENQGETSFVAADGTETDYGTVVVPKTDFASKDADGKRPQIVVKEAAYDVLAMNYILVADSGSADGKTTADLKINVGEVEIEVNNANLKRNYRTNVIGELLTGEGVFTVEIDPIFDGDHTTDWNDGTTDEEVVTKTSDWTLLGTHNEWKSDSKMLLENGLAVAKNVVFPATKAVGDHQFKLYKSVAGENGATVETWVGMSAEAVVPADKYVAAVVGDAGKDVNVVAGTYDIWFDEANKKIYVMTPEKAIKEATEFVAETPEDPDQPEDSWGIVGHFNGWGTDPETEQPVADLAMKQVTVNEIEYWFADNFVVADKEEFKFRKIDGDWADANVFGAGAAAAVDQENKASQPGTNISVAAGTYDIYLDVTNAKYYIMTDGKTPADAEVPETTEVEVYVVKATDWTNNYLYAWDESGATLADAWPGSVAETQTVTINSVEYYKWTLTVPATALGQNAYVIFNNGAATAVQTVDSPAFALAEKQYFKTGALKTLEDGKQQYEIEQIEAPVEETPEQPEQPEQPDYEITTVAEFLAAAEDETIYTLSGTITSVANTTYGNFNLTDDTGTVYIYGLCSPEGAQKYWAESGAKLGDDIVIKTVRTSFNNSPQGKDATFVSLASPGTRPFMNLSKTTVSFTAAGGSENVDLAVYNWTEEVKVTSDNEQFSASYSEGKLTIIAKENNTEAQIKGIITISVGNETETVNVIQAVKSTGEPKTIEVVFKDLGYDNAASVDNEPIEVDDVTFVFAKGNASTAPAYYDSGEAIRMYQNGATLDVSATGKVITSIEITFAQNHYYISADSGELTEEAETRIWTGEATNVKFTSTGTDKDHRAYVKAIKVTYQQ